MDTSETRARRTIRAPKRLYESDDGAYYRWFKGIASRLQRQHTTCFCRRVDIAPIAIASTHVLAALAHPQPVYRLLPSKVVPEGVLLHRKCLAYVLHCSMKLTRTPAASAAAVARN